MKNKSSCLAINRFLSDRAPRGSVLNGQNYYSLVQCKSEWSAKRGGWVVVGTYGEDNLRKYRPCKMIRGKWSSPRPRDTSVCILRQGKHRCWCSALLCAAMHHVPPCAAHTNKELTLSLSLCAIVGASITAPSCPISRRFAIDIPVIRY